MAMNLWQSMTDTQQLGTDLALQQERELQRGNNIVALVNSATTGFTEEERAARLRAVFHRIAQEGNLLDLQIAVNQLTKTGVTINNEGMQYLLGDYYNGLLELIAAQNNSQLIPTQSTQYLDRPFTPEELYRIQQYTDRQQQVQSFLNGPPIDQSVARQLQLEYDQQQQQLQALTQQLQSTPAKTTVPNLETGLPAWSFLAGGIALGIIILLAFMLMKKN